MIERQESRRPGNGQISHFPTARQSPVHLEKIEMRLWLYMSARIGEIVTGEELLDIGWDGKDREGRRLDWNYTDRKIRDQHRHLVIGVFNKIRRVLHSDGQYTIDTTYAKRDGMDGWRLREIADDDYAHLQKEGYLGAYNRGLSRRAQHAEIAAQSRRPALEAPQEPASPADELDGPVSESEPDVSGPLITYVNGTAYYQRPLVDADGQISEQAEVGRGHAAVAELVEGG